MGHSRYSRSLITMHIDWQRSPQAYLYVVVRRCRSRRGVVTLPQRTATEMGLKPI